MTDSIGLAGVRTSGYLHNLIDSLGSSSSQTGQNVLFRTLTSSLSSASGPGEGALYFRSLTGSLTINMRIGQGSSYVQNPKTGLGGGTTLSGNYSCRENIVTNCGTPSAFFAIVTIIIGVLVFGVYVLNQHGPPGPELEEEKSEPVTDDQEGAESTEAPSKEEGGWETKSSRDEEGWETKS